MKKCFPYNTEPCSMTESFPELPNRFPPYYLCNFNQRNSMNDKIDGRREAFIRNSHNIPCGDNLGYQISPSAWWNVVQAPKDTFNPFTVGIIICASILSMNSGVQNGTGETAPIPPVFNPISPSPMRL